MAFVRWPRRPFLPVSERLPPPCGHQLSIESISNAIEKRLFIARLPADTTKEELQEAFEKFGPIADCRVVNGKNLGFVNYETWAAAHHALIETDQKPFPGSSEGKIVVSFAERTNVVGRGGGAHLAKGVDNSRIFMSGLPDTTTEDDLRSLTTRYGSVQLVKLLECRPGRRRNGFVTFSVWGEALDAIEGLHDKPYPSQDSERPGDCLSVKIAEPQGRRLRDDALESQEPAPKRRRTEEGPSSGSSIGLLSCSPRKAEFDSLFVRYRLALDSAAKSDEDCDELHRSMLRLRAEVRETNGASQRGASDVEASGSTAAQDSPGQLALRKEPRLYITGLPRACGDDELLALVQQVVKNRSKSQDKAVLECRMQTGQGCGYVAFSSVEAATEALEALDERKVEGWAQPLRACWATYKHANDSDGEADGGRARGGSGREDSRREPGRSERRGDSRDREGGDADARKHRERDSQGGGRGGRDDRSASRDRGRSPLPRPRKENNQRAEQRRSRSASSSRDRPGRGDGIEPGRLFVGQLRRGVTETDVVRAFEPYGQVEACKLVSDKGVAYVTFSRDSDAVCAKKGLEGASIEGLSRGEGLNVQYSRRRL